MKLGSQKLRSNLRRQLKRLKADDEYFWVFATNCRAVLEVSGKTRRTLAWHIKEPRCNLSGFFNLRSRKLLSVNRLVKFMEHFKIHQREKLFGRFLTLEESRKLQLPPSKH